MNKKRLMSMDRFGYRVQVVPTDVYLSYNTHMNKHNLFIVSWDNTGLEACVDITEDRDLSENFEQEKIFDLIRDPDKVPENKHLRRVNHMVNAMMMRARFNQQRHYKIYTVTTTQDITAQTLRDLFEACPQTAADMIRERGNRLYSDRINQKQIVIT